MEKKINSRKSNLKSLHKTSVPPRLLLHVFLAKSTRILLYIYYIFQSKSIDINRNRYWIEWQISLWLFCCFYGLSIQKYILLECCLFIFSISIDFFLLSIAIKPLKLSRKIIRNVVEYFSISRKWQRSKNKRGIERDKETNKSTLK